VTATGPRNRRLMAGAARYVDTNLHTFDRQMATVRSAGFQDKRATVAGGQISYLEGPDRGLRCC
jgi:hypothetical protein